MTEQRMLPHVTLKVTCMKDSNGLGFTIRDIQYTDIHTSASQFIASFPGFARDRWKLDTNCTSQEITMVHGPNGSYASFTDMKGILNAAIQTLIPDGTPHETYSGWPKDILQSFDKLQLLREALTVNED